MTIQEIKEELKVFEGVRLDETSHTYHISFSDKEPVQAKISMTTLLSKYTTEFDTESQAKRYAEKYHKNVDDVIKGWEFENKLACEKGTAIHNYLEYLFNELPGEYMYDVKKIIDIFGVDVIADKWGKLKYLAQLFKKQTESFLVPIACELKIYDPGTGVAGAVDMLAYHIPSGDLVIIDYKSCKEIELDNFYYKFMKAPFQYLDDINYIHYSLQLNGYQYIIEKNTSLRLRKSHFLVWINEKNDNVEIIPTKNLYKEASVMIENEKYV